MAQSAASHARTPSYFFTLALLCNLVGTIVTCIMSEIAGHLSWFASFLVIRWVEQFFIRVVFKGLWSFIHDHGTSSNSLVFFPLGIHNREDFM